MIKSHRQKKTMSSEYWVLSTEYLKLTDTQQTETESNEHGEVHDTDLGVQVGWSGYI